MSNTKRFVFDLPKDSSETKWLNAQENRRISIKLLIDQAIKKFGYDDLVTSLLSTVDIFDTNGQPLKNAQANINAAKSTIGNRKDTISQDNAAEKKSNLKDSISRDNAAEKKSNLPTGMDRLRHR